MALRTASALALLGATALAQYGGWEDEQANATMCTWKMPRVGIVRDTLYIDGGELYWQQGLQTGEYTPTKESNPRGLMLSLSLKKSFTEDDNITALLDTHPRNSGASKDAIPFYVDGALLANDAQFFLYGGSTLQSDGYSDPESDFVQEFQAHGYKNDDDFEAGFVSEELPEDMNRNVAFGVGVSVPSENKAWYFSGMRPEDYGVPYQSTTSSDERGIPAEVADSFVSVAFDEDSQNSETWKNDTLPSSVGKRGGASGVFVPIGEHGILVFVGGVTHGEFANDEPESPNAAALEDESEVFMTTIDVYDIASDKWYQQKTTGEQPPILALGCAVAQPAADSSSFNIYHYGGYKGADSREDFTDDVWVLSLPSFKWIHAVTGESRRSRAGHRCVSPYPDQMMVVGGFTPLVGTTIDCVPGGVIRVLNLTSLEWLSGYDPEVYGDYGVPKVVSSEIGGDAAGGATAKEPDDGWDDDDLGKVFGKSYPEDKIKTWYPYGSAASTDRPDVDGGKGGKGLPKWVAPTLGVVLGLIFVVVCGVAFVFWRRRKVLRRASVARSSVQEK